MTPQELKETYQITEKHLNDATGIGAHKALDLQDEGVFALLRESGLTLRLGTKQSFMVRANPTTGF